ncbi:hypothetical protein [Vibrio sp. AND4]|uniref:hypothetical protein n=1 Tax=Vibrio sp. AND4 TaxID=314289 RepID=UPI00015F3183|nr:hypothetical protein [Vibrio sp. AND4]EDP60466.1 hypothetical protein AND4_06099 [Vibrio sp. AND4]
MMPRCRYLLPFVLTAIFICRATSASEFSAKATGQDLYWLSLDSVADGQAPSYWDIPVHLPVADKVIPGGVTKVGRQTIKVSHGGKQVNLPIDVQGIIYRLSSVGTVSDDVLGEATATVSGNEVTVIGTGAGEKRITLKSQVSPITHYRPYLSKINKSEWVTSFKNAGATKGRYVGVLPVSAQYDYVRNGTRIRYTLVFSLRVYIDYNPSFLNSISVSGDDNMKVEYDFPLLVKAETTYTVKATGYFTDGIWVGLYPPKGGVFSLKSSTTNKKIKYNVTCTRGCDRDKRVIVDGKPMIDTSDRLIIDATDKTEATAQFKVDFDNISESEFKGGTYTGSFILFFEARI